MESGAVRRRSEGGGMPGTAGRSGPGVGGSRSLESRRGMKRPVFTEPARFGVRGSVAFRVSPEHVLRTRQASHGRRAGMAGGAEATWCPRGWLQRRGTQPEWERFGAIVVRAENARMKGRARTREERGKGGFSADGERNLRGHPDGGVMCSPAGREKQRPEPDFSEGQVQ